MVTSLVTSVLPTVISSVHGAWPFFITFMVYVPAGTVEIE